MILESVKTKNGQNNQQGVYLILMTVGIVLVLALAGLIIDAVKLYRARLRMQNAADAGVIAGLSYRVIRGPTTPEVEITNEAARIINSNLALFNNEINSNVPANFDFDYNPQDVSLAVEYTRNIDLFMLNLIPWGVFQGLGGGGLAYQNGVPVRVNAQSQIGVANVALMLDVSGSMACPAAPAAGAPTPAICYTCISNCHDNWAALGFADVQACIIGNACLVGSRIVELQNAANAFINMFTAGRDRLSLITYNTGARVDSDVVTSGTFTPAGAANLPSANDWTALTGIVDNLSPFGNTNPSSALLEAFRSMNLAGVFNDEQAWYVLFTDGAPTAGRFLFQPRGGDFIQPVPWDDNDVVNRLHSYDFMHFKVTWQDDVDDISGTPHLVTYKGPSQLYKTSVTPTIFNAANNRWIRPSTIQGPRQDNFYNQPDTALLDAAAPPPEIPGCSVLTPPIATFNRDLNSVQVNGVNYRLASNTAIDSCLTRFRYMNPRFRSVAPTGGPFGGTIALTRNQLYQQYYDVTISIADYLRANRGTFFTIGLGQAAPNNGGDSYQNVDDDESRKDRFLARLAFDPYAYNGNRPNLNAADAGVPYLDQAGIQTDFMIGANYTFPIATWNALGAATPYTAPNRGYYYPTPNTAELQLLFTQAARRILLRLIQ